MEKLCILLFNMSMANICYVPLSYIILRGQGIKVLSLISKATKESGFVIPVLDISKDLVGYEGAIVFPPKIAFYEKPIVVLDFASLYPNSIIQKNLSHEMYVEKNSEYDNLPDYDYRDNTFTNTDKTITTCRFAQKKIKQKVLFLLY